MDVSSEEKVEREGESAPRTWRQRHGATLFAIVAMAMLVLLLVLNS